MIGNTMTYSRQRWPEILCLLALLASINGSAQTAQPPPEPTAAAQAATAATAAEEPEELSISADHMEMHLDDHTAELSGNVLVEDSTMKLSAEKMTVYLDDDNKLKRVEANGNVTVRKLDGSESASGDTGTYDALNDVIVLEGDCVILQGKNAIRGNRAIYNRKDQRIRLERATLTIQMKKSDGNDAKTSTFLDNKDKDAGAQSNKPQANKDSGDKSASQDEKGAGAP
jgi:lipopolysaccharide export system protein LptA